jgi:pilus assembly protein Flp/PilA
MIKSVTDKFTRFLLSEDGPTAVEYAVILALIFLTVLAAVNSLGLATSGSFDQSSKSIDALI